MNAQGDLDMVVSQDDSTTYVAGRWSSKWWLVMSMEVMADEDMEDNCPGSATTTV